MPGEEKIYLELGGRRLALSPGERTVGRSHRCDLVVDERSVSRVHAMISWSGGRLSVQDLNSSNGTYINGELLRGEADLCDGDEMQFGEARLRVRRIPNTQSERIPVDALTAAVDAKFTEHRVAKRPPTSPRTDETQSRPVMAASDEVFAGGLADDPVAGDAASDLKTEVYAAALPARGQRDTHEVKALESAFDAGQESGSRSELLSPIDFGDPQQLSAPVAMPATPALVATPTPAVAPAFSPTPLPGPPPAAEFLSRLVAGLLDLLFLMVLTLAASFLRGGMVSPAGRSLALVFALGLATVALVGCWVVWGATPGQRIVGLKVCDDRGVSPLSWSRALRRWVGFAVTTMTLGLGFVSLILHRERLALHDLISGTRVIRKGSM